MKELTFYGPPVVQALRDASHLDFSFFFFVFPLVHFEGTGKKKIEEKIH